MKGNVYYFEDHNIVEKAIEELQFRGLRKGMMAKKRWRFLFIHHSNYPAIDIVLSDFANSKKIDINIPFEEFCRKFVVIHNRTGHYLNIMNDKGETIRRFADTRIIFNCKRIIHTMDLLKGIPLLKNEFSDIHIFDKATNTKSYTFPEYEEGVFYAVSSVFKMASPNRKDFIVPYGIVRNEKGESIGNMGFKFCENILDNSEE